MQKAGLVLWLLVCAVLVLDIGDACVRAQDSSAGLKTQEVDIVNASGTTVIQIAYSEGGPTFDLYDPNGKLRVAPGVIKEGGGIAFEDAKGDNPALLGAIEDKDGLQDTLSITPTEQPSVTLAARSDYSGLEIDDKADKDRATICYDHGSDAPMFATQSAKDQTAIFGGIWGKMAHVVLYDPTGAPRADFGLESNNNAYFAVGGESGEASWEKTFDADGSRSQLGDDTPKPGGSGTGAGTAIRRMGSP